MSNRFSPGRVCDGDNCGCEEVPTNPCILLQDDFNRADSSDPGAEWDEVGSGGSIVSGEFLITGSSQQVIGVDPNPDGPNTKVTVSFKLNASGASARVFLAWLDSSNYLYCRVTTTSIRLGEDGSTFDFEDTAITISTGTWYTLTLCYNGELLIAKIAGIVETAMEGLVPPGTQHGIGTGTGNVTFDNFLAEKVDEDCADCTIEYISECDYCITGNMPRYWRVDISGIVSYPPATPFSCEGTCTDFNGTWILDMDTLASDFPGDEDHGCGGQLITEIDFACEDVLGGGTGPIEIILMIAENSAFDLNDDTYTHVQIGYRNGGTFVAIESFRYYWGDSPVSSPIVPCEDEDMVGLTIPLSGVGGTSCDTSAAVVTITPIS